MQNFCTSSGWSATSVSCVRACPSLNPISNGIFLSQSELEKCGKNPSVNTVCRLICDAGYTSIHETTTCDPSNLMWNPKSLRCVRKCPPLENSRSGTWSPPSCLTTYSGICIFTCAKGFKNHGKNTITCNFTTGQWEGYPVVCQETCKPLKVPSGGNIQPRSICTSSPVVGTICKMKCTLRTSIEGKKLWTCLKGGIWNNNDTIMPSCKAIAQYKIVTRNSNLCITLDKNKKVVTRSSAMDCSWHYVKNRWVVTSKNQLRSVHTGQCLSQGSSNVEVVMADCVDDPRQFFTGQFLSRIVVQNSSGAVLVQNPFKQAIEFSFSTEYDDISAQWRLMFKDDDKTQRTLFGAIFNSCPALIPAYKMTSSGCKKALHAFGDTCTLQCETGYNFISGVSSITATCSTGLWVGYEGARCIPVNSLHCTSYPSTLLMKADQKSINCDNSSRYPEGTVCLFSCLKKTHYIDGDNFIICLPHGRWSRLTPFPCRPYCSALLPLNNSRLTFSSPASCANGTSKRGEICTMECENDYSLDGVTSLTCTANGLWSAPIPTCRKMCPSLPISHVQNIKCSTQKKNNKYIFGTVCTVLCQPGYFQPVNNTITCLNNGEWSNLQFNCDPACLMFKNSSIEMISPSSCLKGLSKIGTKCTITCNIGYYIVGDISTKSIVRTCIKDKTWSGPFPFCAKSCPPITYSLGNGYYEPSLCATNYHHAGSICHLRCHALLKIHGPPSVMCHNGTWRPYPIGSAFGTCLSVCKTLSKPKYAIISPYTCVKGPVTAGTECIIDCPINMERIGPGTFKCMKNSQSVTAPYWSDSRETKCVAKCPPLQLTSSLNVLPKTCAFNYKTEKTHCSFHCDGGMSIFGPKTLICKVNGMWSDDVPVCYHTCLGVQIFGGNLFCTGLVSGSAVGYVFLPGSRCNYLCDLGYTAYTQNEVTCTSEGLWEPEPYCQANLETFTMFQKIESNFKCLIAKWNNANIGEEWILGFLNSSESCTKAGNNALWMWLEQNNIKHAETGLCITAEQSKREALILLEPCDVNNDLQHWNCDVLHPYRVILKGTHFSIDSSYEKAGPLLSEWTYSRSYWMTFNNNLEVTASICSYKVIGTCPPLRLPNMKVTPAVCSTNEVLPWQECELSCLDENRIQSTTCLLTGIWKNLDVAQCIKNCSPLSREANKLYMPSSCSTAENMPHLSTCIIKCGKGYKLENKKDSYSLSCNNGVWVGETSKCLLNSKFQQLKNCSAPISVNNGLLVCNSKVCNFSCNSGFKRNNNKSPVIECEHFQNLNVDVAMLTPTCEVD